MTTTNRDRIERIRERAYELWDRTHRPERLDLQFWLLAERELGMSGKDRVEQAGPPKVHGEGRAA